MELCGGTRRELDSGGSRCEWSEVTLFFRIITGIHERSFRPVTDPQSMAETVRGPVLDISVP